jgi:hypothetical protein
MEPGPLDLYAGTLITRPQRGARILKQFLNRNLRLALKLGQREFWVFKLKFLKFPFPNITSLSLCLRRANDLFKCFVPISHPIAFLCIPWRVISLPRYPRLKKCPLSAVRVTVCSVHGREIFSRMLYRVVWQRLTELREHCLSFCGPRVQRSNNRNFGKLFQMENGASAILRNVSKLLLDHTLSHTRSCTLHCDRCNFSSRTIAPGFT